jgi:hypothetical protein
MPINPINGGFLPTDVILLAILESFDDDYEKVTVPIMEKKEC